MESISSFQPAILIGCMAHPWARPAFVASFQPLGLLRQQQNINRKCHTGNHDFRLQACGKYIPLTHSLEPFGRGDAAEGGGPVEPLLRSLVELDVDAHLAAGAPQSSAGGGPNDDLQFSSSFLYLSIHYFQSGFSRSPSENEE